MRRPLIERNSVTSAFGMLTAPLAFDFVQSYIVTLSELDFAVLEQMYAEMEKRGRALLETAGVVGELSLIRSADMRYLHQGFEIRVPLPTGHLTQEELPALRHKLEQTTARVLIFLVDLQVLCQLFDLFSKDSNLNLRRPGVLFVGL